MVFIPSRFVPCTLPAPSGCAWHLPRAPSGAVAVTQAGRRQTGSWPCRGCSRSSPVLWKRPCCPQVAGPGLGVQRMCSALAFLDVPALLSGFSPGAAPGPLPLECRSLKGSLGVKRCEQGAEGTRCLQLGVTGVAGGSRSVLGGLGRCRRQPGCGSSTASRTQSPVSCPLPLGGSRLTREWREAALEGSGGRANRAPSLHARLLCPGVQERSRPTQPPTWSHLGEETRACAAYLSEPKLERLPQCQYLTLSRGGKDNAWSNRCPHRFAKHLILSKTGSTSA